MLTVRAILGHRHLDTTLGYARLYDGTVAADYYRAMAQVERQLPLGEQGDVPAALSPGQLVALVDALRAGTLNAEQIEMAGRLRAGLIALAEHRLGEHSGGQASGS